MTRKAQEYTPEREIERIEKSVEKIKSKTATLTAELKALRKLREDCYDADLKDYLKSHK